MISKNLLNGIRDNKFELKNFYLGIILLPSLPSISAIFLLLSVILLSIKSKSYLKDLFNITLLLSSFLIILSCILNTVFINNIYKGVYEIDQNWIGILNWLPYFYFFWLFQKFSTNMQRRKKIIFLFLLGSIPVIISCITQYFFKLHGPFTFLNGLIIFYSRKIDPMDGMTGLFSNTNYLGIWLNIIWPFSLVFFIDKKSKPKIRVLSAILIFTILLCTILTFSRSAWLGLLLGSLIILGLKSLKWILPSLLLIVTPVLIGLGFWPNNNLVEISQKLIPEIILHQFKFNAFENLYSLTRVQIWSSSLKYIFERPLIGWGSSSFPILFKIDNGQDFFAHSHNIILEIAISYGIPAALLIIGTILTLIYISKGKIFLRNSLGQKYSYDKAWWAAVVIIFFCHMFDVQYFDVRIALTLWILLGGLRNIIRIEDYQSKNIF